MQSSSTPAVTGPKAAAAHIKDLCSVQQGATPLLKLFSDEFMVSVYSQISLSTAQGA